MGEQNNNIQDSNSLPPTVDDNGRIMDLNHDTIKSNNEGSEVSPSLGLNASSNALSYSEVNNNSQTVGSNNGSDSTQSIQNTTSVGAMPSIADDVDLIEKEWVEKAKEIVEKTRDNPYLQNKAISEIKSDYIKKRYNKDIAATKE